MTYFKTGSRILGIAESYRKGDRYAVLAGVVYRLDRGFDGVWYRLNTVGGLDSTENILWLIREMGREDINAILLSGVVISWYNIVDLERIHRETGLPLIAITYEETEGIARYIMQMPRWEDRLLLYLRLGPRKEAYLNGHRIYIRTLGITEGEAIRLLRRLTPEGRIPRPISIASMAAYAAAELLRSCHKEFINP